MMLVPGVIVVVPGVMEVLLGPVLMLPEVPGVIDPLPLITVPVVELELEPAAPDAPTAVPPPPMGIGSTTDAALPG